MERVRSVRWGGEVYVYIPNCTPGVQERDKVEKDIK